MREHVIERKTASTSDNRDEADLAVQRCEHGPEWVVELATGRIRQKPCPRCARFAPPMAAG